MELKPTQLGKKMKLQYIPFSELIIPWDVCVDSTLDPEQVEAVDLGRAGALILGAMTPDSLKTLKSLKQANLEALKTSIGQFGLLRPFEVAKLPQDLGFFFGKGKFVVIDGQRRYFAIRELLRLPSEQDERRQKERVRTLSGDDHVKKAEAQAQEHLEKLSIRDYVLVPCLVYPYKTYLQMVRHSTEDSKVSEKSSKVFAEIVDKMRQQGILDLDSDDLSSVWDTRNALLEEQQAIEQTLQEIRNRKPLR
jgi:hypothetical protein